MKLSREEENFLRHWMYDETHYREHTGLAKRLQVEQGAIPADLATIIAAAIPSLADQELAAIGPPPSEPPAWPWVGDSLATRKLRRVSQANKSQKKISSPLDQGCGNG